MERLQRLRPLSFELLRRCLSPLYCAAFGRGHDRFAVGFRLLAGLADQVLSLLLDGRQPGRQLLLERRSASMRAFFGISLGLGIRLLAAVDRLSQRAVKQPAQDVRPEPGS